MNKVIGCLFDDGEMCYYNSIKELYSNYEIHSIGINKKSVENYHVLDLRISNDNLFKELDKLPKPDIILASPPCESGSIADCGGRMVRGFSDCVWFINNNKYYDEYNKNAHKNKVRSFMQKEKSRIIGEDTQSATIEIIRKYKPKIGVIENPATSKIGDFQAYHHQFTGIHNITNYGDGDDTFSQKKTNFKSNMTFDFNIQCKKQYNKKHMDSGYNQRSSIPKGLIWEIIGQIEKHMN